MQQGILVDLGREPQDIGIRDLAAIIGGIRTVDLISRAIGERPITSCNIFDLSLRIGNVLNATYIEVVNNKKVIGWCVDDDISEKLILMLKQRHT